MTNPETLELEAVDNALAGRYVAPEHAELAELALLLRDDRPEPAPAWATHLDRRVEARFPSRPRERKFRVWLRNVSPALGLAACVLLVIGLVTLPTGSDDSDEGGSSASGGASTAASRPAFHPARARRSSACGCATSRRLWGSRRASCS